MSDRPETRGTPSTLAGVPPKRPAHTRDVAVTDQLESEINQQHEASALDDEEPAERPEAQPGK